jgi:hypothetical protein
VKARTAGLGETLERLLPFLTVVAIITAGWFWFVQPRLVAYLRSRTDTAALEERVRTMQQVSNRAPPAPAADLERTVREFEARVSAGDKVAEVAAALAQSVLANAPAGQLRSFVIDTGDRVSTSRGAAAERTSASGDDGPDPRLALFPFAVSYTPMRVSFDSTFEATANVLWQLRDLPTVVEVRSATLTRGLPLMKTELLVRVLQRGGAIEAAAATVPAAAAAPVPGPTAPRLAPSAPEPGAAR